MEGVEELTNMVLSKLSEVESGLLTPDGHVLLNMSDSDDDLSLEERRLASARFSILESHDAPKKRRQRAFSERGAIRTPPEGVKRKTAKRRARGSTGSFDPPGIQGLDMSSKALSSVKCILHILGVPRVTEAEAANFTSRGDVVDFLEHHDAPELQGEHYLRQRYFGVEAVPLQTVKYRCVHMLSCALRPDVPLQRIETCVARTARKLNLRVSNWLPGHITTERGGYQSGVPEWHLMDCQVVLDIHTKVRTLLVRYILVLPLPVEVAEQGRDPSNRQSYTKASNMALKVALVHGGVSLSTIGSCRHLPKEAFRKGADAENLGKDIVAKQADIDEDQELEPSTGRVPLAGAKLIPMALVHEMQESELASAGLFNFNATNDYDAKSPKRVRENGNGTEAAHPDAEVGFSLDAHYCVQLWSYSRHSMRMAYKKRLADLEKEMSSQNDLWESVRSVLEPCYRRFKIEVPSEFDAEGWLHKREASEENLSDLAAMEEFGDVLGSRPRSSLAPRRRDMRRRRQKNALAWPGSSFESEEPAPVLLVSTVDTAMKANAETKCSTPVTPTRAHASHGFLSRENSLNESNVEDLTTCDFGLRVPLNVITAAVPLCEGIPPQVRKDDDGDSSDVALAYLLDQMWLEKAIRELWSHLDAKCDAKLSYLVEKANGEYVRRLMACKRRTATLFWTLASSKTVAEHSYTKSFWKLLDNFATGSPSASAQRGLSIIEQKEAVIFWTNIMYASTSTGIFYLTPRHIACVIYSIFGFAKEIILIHLQALQTVKLSEGLLRGVELTWQREFFFGDEGSPKTVASSPKRHEGLVIIPTMQRAQHIVDLITAAKESLSVPTSHVYPSGTSDEPISTS